MEVQKLANGVVLIIALHTFGLHLQEQLSVTGIKRSDANATRNEHNVRITRHVYWHSVRSYSTQVNIHTVLIK